MLVANPLGDWTGGPSRPKPPALNMALTDGSLNRRNILEVASAGALVVVSLHSLVRRFGAEQVTGRFDSTNLGNLLS